MCHVFIICIWCVFISVISKINIKNEKKSHRKKWKINIQGRSLEKLGEIFSEVATLYSCEVYVRILLEFFGNITARSVSTIVKKVNDKILCNNVKVFQKYFCKFTGQLY